MISPNVLTENEVDAVIARFLKHRSASQREIEMIIDQLAVYTSHGLIAEGILSGEFEITGCGDDGIEYCLSGRSKRYLH